MNVLRRLSRLVSRIETVLGAFLALAITVLILLNVVTRSTGNSLFWVDEAAISAMVWMGFLGASVATHHRQSVAVTLLPDALPPALARRLGKLVDLCVLVFAAVLLVLTWQWFDPLTLAAHGFDAKAYSSATFNFIYSETTTTLGIRKFWLWLIMPFFSFAITLHALSHLLTPEPAPVEPQADVPLVD